MRWMIRITTLKEPICFLAKGTTRAEARAEALAFIHGWSLTARNQPCGFRIEQCRTLFPDAEPLPTKGGDSHDA